MVSVIDFFSGCGGTSVGLKAAGMQVRLGIDNNADASMTFRENFPEASFIERDVREVSVDEVRARMGEGPNLFAGCAPCQPFSKQNRQKKRNDARASLLGEFERFALELLPEYVVVENVPGLQRVGEKGPFPQFRESLQRAGYSVESGVLRAADYGVPQLRPRLVLVASLVSRATLPIGLETAPPTVRQTISHLEAIGAGESSQTDPDHAAMNLSELNLARIRATPEGGGREAWPTALISPCHARHAGHTDTYGRMAWDRPASGLTTRCLSYSNGRFGHPTQDRAISAREAALLQTFPSDFRFAGSLGSKGMQIGNAVPPRFAQIVGQSLTGLPSTSG